MTKVSYVTINQDVEFAVPYVNHPRFALVLKRYSPNTYALTVASRAQ